MRYEKLCVRLGLNLMLRRMEKFDLVDFTVKKEMNIKISCQFSPQNYLKIIRPYSRVTRLQRTENRKGLQTDGATLSHKFVMLSYSFSQNE